ncbi:type II toxin-antitoxin system HicA family toxin [Gallibacterium anatis]|uniref:Type II toxin-antitoxin system HicA family toxin n=1 Tax=Gallibacterium anatis TaxID=750 RepID=A0A1A7PA29_9PAST|nr:type II toxin-antitoxin system HicA family toxin [Gallibacterium anatis]KGQ27397.1 mRNA interferase [Gallibacterium anatis]KGQ27401.1 mRNA interferase [Gallibacterium anatis]KGQ40589.1 mRNA interferase [Gallibacterium anatis]KGQ50051.1 mRNA interferase [Gallibacterium anatis 10672-6]KGQ56121.1 mRNA interferase [Gallibacterium anatis str. Avicor]
MKQSEFLRWLKAQGVEVKDGSNHIKLYLNGKQSVLPRHPSKEIARGTEIAVKKQLGLK